MRDTGHIRSVSRFLYFTPNISTNFQNPLDIFLNLYYNKSVMQT